MCPVRRATEPEPQPDELPEATAEERQQRAMLVGNSLTTSHALSLPGDIDKKVLIECVRTATR